jgi:ribosome-associated protein
VSPQPVAPAAVSPAQRFAIEIARLAAHTRCRDVVVLDVRGLSPVTDFFVIATGTSARQMKTVCEDVEEMAETLSYSPFSCSGLEGETWMLVDFIDVMFHIFSQEARDYYDLEGLWGDAKRLDWQPTDQPSSP